MSAFGLDAKISGQLTVGSSTTPGVAYTSSSKADVTLTNSTAASNLPFLNIQNTAGGAGAVNIVGINMSPWSTRSGGPSTSIRAIDDIASSAHLAFYTANGGNEANTLLERMRVANTGWVGINSTAPTGLLHVKPGILASGSADSPAIHAGPIQDYYYGVDDSVSRFSGVYGKNTVMSLNHTSNATGQTYIRFVANGQQLATLVSTGNSQTVTLNQGSDFRMKSNISDYSLDEGGTTVDNLFPVTFTYNSDDTETTQYGFIAQDVAGVVPACVHIPKDPTEFWTMSMTPMIPHIVAALKQTREELRTALARITALENK